VVLAVFGMVCRSSRAWGTDYFLTLGGGYNPAGNQASLEANVLFFQAILDERHAGPRVHDVFFADGNDPRPDLQVLAAKPDRQPAPATEVLAALHRRLKEEAVEYRNHRVPGLTGALDPARVQQNLKSLGKTARPGDRLFVYVTAHGSEGPDKDPFNTTIDCWNQKKITAREFTRWLDVLPDSLPVIMVMAQCYCGGFTHSIYRDLDRKLGLAPQLRIGFFAQQHDLPAAGCRPDISNDDEFSSYFWGALAGRSRVGVPITTADRDGNGEVSFAEAYAYAVIASPTIDIPLRASDALLRDFSRLGPVTTGNEPASALAPVNEVRTLTGPVSGFVRRGDATTGRIVTELCRALDCSLDDTVQDVLAKSEESRRNRGRRPFDPRRRSGSGRRELLQQVRDKWPELADPEHWHESKLLAPANQEALFAELQNLPGWQAFDDRRKQLQETSRQAERRELKDVQFRRLIQTLEIMVLAENLPRFADAKIQARYQDMLKLEQQSLKCR